MTFSVPVAEQKFLLRHVSALHELPGDDGARGFDADLVDAVVEGAARFAEAEFAPLMRVGDTIGPKWNAGKVTMPDGFRSAYRAFVDGGWGAICAPSAHGGQALPFAIGTAVTEALSAANLGFAAGPMLTAGVIEALDAHGSTDQKSTWLPRLVSGEWAGTMNLTEPQAGTDVGAVRTTATPTGEGLYRIRGQKIFISFGDHDLTANIAHLVLARTPGAPAGSKGISLFLVPKFRLDADGEPTIANGVQCLSIEDKLGLHASPTCVMSYGEGSETLGEMIGVECGGLRAMFTMMNHARINVGNQGVQVAERARQKAIHYAFDRIQSPRADGSSGSSPVPIIDHPDVRRMVLRMNALTQGARALLYYAAGQFDRAKAGDPAARARLNFVTPIVKAYGSDVGCEVASLAIQIHGGAGFIEETGAAQHYRDARIMPIYEGANGIQSADLVERKVMGDRGAVLNEVIETIRSEVPDEPDIQRLAVAVGEAAGHMLGASVNDRLAGSYPFLTMVSVLMAGWLMARQRRALEAAEQPELDPAFCAAKRAAARFYIDHLVPEAVGLKPSAMAGADLFYSLDRAALGV